jgi:surface protein
MSNQLQQNLNAILEDKISNLLPENLKAGVTCLGVTGNLEVGNSSNVKKFDTIDEMKVSADVKDGDLAIVYGRRMLPFAEGTVASVFTLPKIVQVGSSVDYGNMHFTCGLGSGELAFDPNYCSFTIYEEAFDPETGESSYVTKISVQWNSSDRITYIMTNFRDESKTLSGDEIVGDQVVNLVSPITNISLGNIYATLDGKDRFLLVDAGMYFEGLYQYNSNTGYEVADNQFTANSSSVAIGESFLGGNGVQTGALGIDAVSLLLNDAAATTYIALQKKYDEIQIIGTDANPTAGISNKLTVIPNKSDGTCVLNTSGVTNMDGAFEDWKLLEKGPLIDTSNVTSMKNMFDSTFALTEVPLYDTSKVKNMYSMFSHSGINSIPLFNTSNVTNMSYMFSNTNIVTAPAFDMSKVTNISRMFSSCDSLQTVPLYDWSSVTNVSYVFQFATNLSDESLNNIMGSLLTCSVVSTLKSLGLSAALATKCQSLSNYQALIDKGWTTGY